MLIVSGGVIGGGGFILGLTAGDLSDAFLLGAAGAMAVVAVSALVGGIKWLFALDRKMGVITDAIATGFDTGTDERRELATELAERHEAVLEIAQSAATAANAATEKVDTNTSALTATIEAGFDAAKHEQQALAERLDRSIQAQETFTTAAIAVSLGAIARLDALDGKNTVADLQALIERGGLPPDPDEVIGHLMRPPPKAGE